MDLKKILGTKEYEFIKSNVHLGRYVILLGLSGSYSYGTNNENSDINIRGIALNRKSDLLGMTQFEQYVDLNTDTYAAEYTSLPEEPDYKQVEEFMISINEKVARNEI